MSFFKILDKVLQDEKGLKCKNCGNNVSYGKFKNYCARAKKCNKCNKEFCHKCGDVYCPNCSSSDIKRL